MIEKLRAALTDWMAVSDAEVEREFRTRNEKVKLQVVALTADAFRDQVTVTDADVAAYFERTRRSTASASSARSRCCCSIATRRCAKVTVPPADMQRYYNDNIAQYQTPEQVRASHILLKTEGKDEAAVRKQAEDMLQAGQGAAPTSRRSRRSTPRTRARRPTAATSTTSAAAAWCRSSKRRRSR